MRRSRRFTGVWDPDLEFRGERGVRDKRSAAAGAEGEKVLHRRDHRDERPAMLTYSPVASRIVLPEVPGWLRWHEQNLESDSAERAERWYE
jgi:hypothetical protein